MFNLYSFLEVQCKTIQCHNVIALVRLENLQNTAKWDDKINTNRNKQAVISAKLKGCPSF